MTPVILFSIILILIVVLIYILKKSYKEYPPYYHDVYIKFKFPGEDLPHRKKAWLAVNDNEELIWTCSDSNIIIKDDWVIDWEEI